MTISIRLRLTLWYSAAVAVLLLAVAGGLVVVQTRVSVARLDAELRRVNATVATVLQNELNEGLTPAVAAEDALRRWWWRAATWRSSGGMARCWPLAGLLAPALSMAPSAPGGTSDGP